MLDVTIEDENGHKLKMQEKVGKTVIVNTETEVTEAYPEFQWVFLHYWRKQQQSNKAEI